MAQLINEAKRWQKLANILIEAVEVPSWLAGKLEDVHTKPGQGSIFAKSISDVLKLAQGALDKESNIDKIANSTGTLTIKSPGIGYNLVLPIEQAKKLPGAKESEVEKVEGPSKIKVPAITTTAPLTQFTTDELTVIVRPKKDESGAVIPNEYIVLSAFPGDPSIPRASEWGGKYAVIIPGKKNEINEGMEMSDDEFESFIDNIWDKIEKEEFTPSSEEEEQQFAEMVAYRANNEIKNIDPHLSVESYTFYGGGKVEFTLLTTEYGDKEVLLVYSKSF